MGKIRANVFAQAFYTESYGSCKHLYSAYIYKNASHFDASWHGDRSTQANVFFSRKK